MKRFFLFVFAVTVGILFFLAAVGGAWWYYENRDPDLTAELTAFSSPEYEGEIYWGLYIRIENNDSKDYTPDEWGLRLYNSDGDIIPFTLKLKTDFDTELYADERTTFTFRTELKIEEDLFSPAIDMDLSGSRADAEKYINNLERFRERFWSDEILLINDSVNFRQKLSIKDYYEEQLVRRRQILARQGDPIDDPVYREKLEATPFCDSVETYPCRYLNMTVSSDENFSSEEFQKRMASLPECDGTPTFPCKIVGKGIIGVPVALEDD